MARSATLTRHPSRSLAATACILLLSCGSDFDGSESQGEIGFDPARPSLGEPSGSSATYSGSNEVVLQAQERLTTGLDLHRRVIFRTCGPDGGVCHNAKEYPDLHTPANLLSAIDAPCNVQPGGPDSVFDRCERPGDRIQLGDDGRVIEIGFFDRIPGDFDPSSQSPDSDTPGLHFFLADPLGKELDDDRREARFIRSFVTEEQQVEELGFFRLTTNWWTLDDGAHLFARVPDYLSETVQELLTVGIIEGDANRNGLFGAREGDPLSLIEPGSPETSYLIGRMRGTLQGDEVPGTLMPLANQPLDTAEMLSLFCFIQGLEPGKEPDLASAIDYGSCSYSADPESLNLLGAGITWASRISSILEFNCGGCHAGQTPQGGLNLVDGDVYGRLLEPSVQKPELSYVEPGDPASSYLWLKLTGEASITGAQMPLDASGQPRSLSDAGLNDIRTWIEAGAIESE